MIDWDEIRELPVPEEWIAAYMDGELDSSTASYVEDLLIGSPEHAGFVDTLKDSWNLSGNSMDSLESSEMDLAEALTIDSMDLPLVGADNVSNEYGYDGLGVASDCADCSYPSISGWSEDLHVDDSVDWMPYDENMDIFSPDTDSFPGNDPSLDIDTPDVGEDLSDN